MVRLVDDLKSGKPARTDYYAPGPCSLTVGRATSELTKEQQYATDIIPTKAKGTRHGIHMWSLLDAISTFKGG